MFDLSQVSESLKSAVPPPSYLGFTFYELKLIESALKDFYDYISNEYDDDSDIIISFKKIFQKFNTYEFH